jgi:hypothetical protein
VTFGARLKTLFFEQRGVFFNALFLVYLATLQPLLLGRMDAVINRDQRDVFVGTLILLIMVLETLGLWLKVPPVMRRLLERDPERNPAGIFFFAVWALHTVLSALLLFPFLKSFGLDRNEAVGITLLVLVVLKELVLLGYLMIGAENRARKLLPGNLSRAELAGDLLLFLFASVAFSATWGVISPGVPVFKGNLALILVNLFGSGLIFLILFLPLRMVYVIEEWNTRGYAPWLVATTLLNTVAAVWSLG